MFHRVQLWNNGHVPNKKMRRKAMVNSFRHILRSKGFFWIAGQDKFMGLWTQSGRIIAIHPAAAI
jgi:G3E family GTPase